MNDKSMWFHAWIGLGGNIGDVTRTMTHALCLLERHADVRIAAVSSLYKTPPWGKLEQPWFLNACAHLLTIRTPDALLQLCLDIEEELHRQRVEKWGPRTLDIDILLYEQIKCMVPGRLTLPHPHITERAFVLMPLAEINPELDVEGQSALERAQQSDDGTIEKLSDGSTWWQIKAINTNKKPLNR